MIDSQPLTLRKLALASVRFPRGVLRSRPRTRRGASTRVEVAVDLEDVLARLRDLPVSTWSYDFDHSSVRHLGPVAQDFAAAFGLGDSARRIDVVDSAGVALAAIKALALRVEELERRVRALESDGARPSDRARGALGDDRTRRTDDVESRRVGRG